MRRKRRVDSNQAEIVKALRDCGCSVECLSDVGRGVPDLLVKNPDTLKLYLLEVKRPGEDLNAVQCRWMEEWDWLPGVVSTAKEALNWVGMGKYWVE